MVLQMLGDPQRDVDEALLHFDLINNTTLSFSGLDYTEGLNMYTGGRWSGWHCEGTPLKSLFSLIMWEVLFLDKVENVFYTPYQDQPLDLQYGAVFYMHRKAEIDSRFKWLENAHMSEILADLSRIYRKYYKCRCISMSWVHPLHILQVIFKCYFYCALIKAHCWLRTNPP